MTNHETDLLLQKIASGDMQALERLYRSLSRPVYFYVLRIVGEPNAAEDIMQDTFISVIHGCEKYRHGDGGNAWIFTIAKNRALDYLRKEKHSFPVETAPDSPDDTDMAENRLALLRFEEMLTPLSKKERDIVILRLLSGFTLTQISVELELPKGSVFWSYNNAIKKLRKHLKETDIDE